MNSNLFIFLLLSLLLLNNENNNGNVANAQFNASDLNELENATMYSIRTKWSLSNVWLASGKEQKKIFFFFRYFS